MTIGPGMAPAKLKVPVAWPLAAVGEAVTVPLPVQRTPAFAQAVALAFRLVLVGVPLPVVTGVVPAGPGACECRAKTSALAPPATTIRAIIAISISFVL